MVQNVTPMGFILALFIRDDGERLLLGSGAYEFKKEQLHFAANLMQNDVVEIQGNDGALLAGQVRRASTQPFDGYIADASVCKTPVETYRRQFIGFFVKNHKYQVVYVFPDGSSIQRRRGYIVDAPEVKELYQMTPEYHVALGFEDVNYYSYAEDADGNEIYSTADIIPAAMAQGGGLIWDEYGVVWDNIGAEWAQGGSGAITTIVTQGIANSQPTITITGPATNPIIENITTAQIMRYTGNVTSSQVLVINTSQKTALLNGTSVVGNISGDWVYLAPGENRMTYTTTNADATNAKLEWQEVVG